MSERRPGNSRLVFDKTTKTIAPVDSAASKRAKLDQALRDWIWRQSSQNSADLYRVGCEYFGITPALPD